MRRELIYMDAKSSKFWTIELQGSGHTVTYGRIGSAGQTSSKSFASEEAARKDFDKLVKEKLSKGYVEKAGQETSGDELPLVAFTSINHRDEISSNLGTFIGMRVVDYDPDKPTRSDVVYRLRATWEKEELPLESFLASEAAAQARGLVIGAWQVDDSSVDSSSVVSTLARAAGRLGKLVALYLGDIVSEECEISWINQCDLTPLLQAFPSLQLLRVRGGEGLALSAPRHACLRGLALEAGGLDVGVIRSVCQADFPELEYLELWLGTSDYGATATVADLQPLLSGRLFPKLKYLGLRNSELADELAGVLVNSPVVERLETLDLSLGVLTDEGGQSLLKLSSPTLKKLNLHYNYFSPELSRQLKALPFAVDVSRPADMEEEEEWRFVAVGE
jgi:predicted DNA-binding WGR domain protein